VVVALSLLAAITYGVADFFGAVSSRHRSAVTVVLYSYPVGALLICAVLPAFPGPLSGRTALFGSLAGVFGLIGVVIMFSLMAIAPMNIISPVTAVLAAAVPVAFGVLIGERPAVAAWFGVLLGLIAVVLVSRTPQDHPHGRVAMGVLSLALVTGVAYGLYFIFLARADSDSGLWPVAIGRLVSSALVVPFAWWRKAVVPLTGKILLLVLATGAFDAIANVLFLLATRHGFLSLVSVITSMYPAATVLLAIMLLHEHTGRLQRVGLGLAAVALVLITR